MKILTRNCSRSLDSVSCLELRIGLVFAVILFSFAVQLDHAHAASFTPNISYNCANSHCYSEFDWGGAPGAYTALFTNQIYAGNGFVTNEMWLVSVSGEWVEAGAISTVVDMKQGSGTYNHGSSAEFLFWGDVNDRGVFYFHPGPNLASSDFGKTMSVEIQNTTTGTYAVNIWGLPSASLSGSSTDNTMSDDYIQVGGELYGTSSATNPTNGFAYNEWFGANAGNWYFQGSSTNGSPSVQAPWSGAWASTPQADGDGGDWRICLANAGC